MIELTCMEGFDNLTSSLASNTIELNKISPENRIIIEQLSNEILTDYYQGIVDEKKTQKLYSLTSNIDTDPIELLNCIYTNLSSYNYLENDLVEIISEFTYSKILDKVGDVKGNSLMLWLLTTCEGQCTLLTLKSGLEDTEMCYARTIFYSGCVVGCYSSLE